MRNISCGVCERPIGVRDNVDVALCIGCAQHPVLVEAFKEGRARLLHEEIEDYHTRSEQYE